MAASVKGRGIGNMGDIRRPSPMRHFLHLYGSQNTFQAMIDFVVLGGLTIAFLEPQLLLHPLAHLTPTPVGQQQAAPAPTPSPPVQRPVAPPASTPAPAIAAPASKPSAETATPVAASVVDSSKAVANLKKLAPWPLVALAAVNTPGLHDVPIPFSGIVLGAQHPASRYLTVDDRAFANLSYQLREKVKAALDARADQDPDRMRAALKDVDSPEGTPELLTGLSYLINASADTTGLAETSYRAALQKGQPQAPVLLGLLLTSGSKGLNGTPAEGRALIDAVADQDRLAWLATGIGFMSGENGALDPGKALPLVRRAAEAGEPLALLQYARLAEGGIGMEKDVGLAEAALRRAADLGLTEAEDTLGRWIMLAYEKHKLDDPTEGVRLEERVLAKHLVFASNTLGRMYQYYGQGTWKDVARGAKLIQACAEYKLRPCQNNFGLSLQFGRGVDRDPVAAWARYDVARQLPGDFTMSAFADLDKVLTPGEKDEAHRQSKEIMAQLKPQPVPIALRRDR
jgi:TPR repeat protein